MFRRSRLRTASGGGRRFTRKSIPARKDRANSDRGRKFTLTNQCGVIVNQGSLLHNEHDPAALSCGARRLLAGCASRPAMRTALKRLHKRKTGHGRYPCPVSVRSVSRSVDQMLRPSSSHHRQGQPALRPTVRSARGMASRRHSRGRHCGRTPPTTDRRRARRKCRA